MTVSLLSTGRWRCAAWLIAIGFLAVLLFPLASHPAQATGGVSDEAGDITIIDATIDPARRGASTHVRGHVENRGSRTVTLQSIETTMGERGSFDLHAGRGSIHTASLSIGAGEQVSFDDDRFRLALGPLLRDLSEGDVVEIKLTFHTFELRVSIHVHHPQAKDSERKTEVHSTRRNTLRADAGMQ
jgi:copper(I)-binding protein